MLAVLCSTDRSLQERVGMLCSEFGIRVLKTAQPERIIKELKRPGCFAIIDMAEEAIQERGVLRQMINVGKISDNPVVCICPNQDEDLKKMARSARPAEVFLRYDMLTTFKEYLSALALQAKESKAS